MENVNQENLISIFSQGVSARSLPKLPVFNICVAKSNSKDGRFVPLCSMTILTQNITITVPKFKFQLHLQGQLLFNLQNTHLYANNLSQPSIHTSYIMTDQIESRQVEDLRVDRRP